MIAWILLVSGAFSALGGVMNWEWFMNNRRARLVVRLLGRSGARGFYVLLGLAIAGIGAAGLLGFIDMSR